jgi:hypothetical protein
MKKTIWILWPSFLAAAVGTTLFFTALDPQDFGFPGRGAGYTAGFFFFWALAAGSSALTCFLQRRREEVNRCPFAAVERPLGCPKGEDRDAIC